MATVAAPAGAAGGLYVRSISSFRLGRFSCSSSPVERKCDSCAVAACKYAALTAGKFCGEGAQARAWQPHDLPSPVQGKAWPRAMIPGNGIWNLPGRNGGSVLAAETHPAPAAVAPVPAVAQPYLHVVIPHPGVQVVVHRALVLRPVIRQRFAQLPHALLGALLTQEGIDR